MVGHGGILAFDDRTDMRDVARHLLHFGAARELRQVLPVPDRPRSARTTMFAERRSRSTATRLEDAAGDAGARLASARTAAACRRRSAACSSTSPTSWGSHESIASRVDGVEVEVAAGATVLDAARAAGRWVPTLCFDERQDPFGACRVCLVGVEGGAARTPADPGLHDALPRRAW